MSQPGFDRWLTTDRIGEAWDKAMEQLMAEWEAWAEHMGISPMLALENHPDHAVYLAWAKLMDLAYAVLQRDEAEAEAAQYEDEQSLEEHFREGFDEGRPPPRGSAGL